MSLLAFASFADVNYNADCWVEGLFWPRWWLYLQENVFVAILGLWKWWDLRWLLAGAVPSMPRKQHRRGVSSWMDSKSNDDSNELSPPVHSGRGGLIASGYAAMLASLLLQKKTLAKLLPRLDLLVNFASLGWRAYLIGLGVRLYIYYDHLNDEPPCELMILHKNTISRNWTPFWKGECLGYNAK